MPPKQRSRARHSPRRKKVIEELPVSTPPGRKRKMSKTSGEKEKKSAKKPKEVEEVGLIPFLLYCWMCHRVGQDKQCSKCARGYHTNCSKKFNEQDVCHQCQQELNSKQIFQKEMSLTDLNSSFRDIIHNALTHKKTLSVDESQLSIDLMERCSIADNYYQSPYELMADVRDMYHNCVILHDKNSTPASKTKMLAAKKLEQDFKLEIDHFMDCPKCYRNKDDVELSPIICEKPHAIVWAKVRGYSYWPAKVLKVVNGKVHVRFFFTNQWSSQIKDVLFMSKEYPASKDLKKGKEEFESSMIELQEYIEEFEKRFRVQFPFEKENTVFNVNKANEIWKKIPRKHDERVGRNSACEILQDEAHTSVIDLTGDEDGLGDISAVDEILMEEDSNIRSDDEQDQLMVVDQIPAEINHDLTAENTLCQSQKIYESIVNDGVDPNFASATDDESEPEEQLNPIPRNFGRLLPGARVRDDNTTSDVILPVLSEAGPSGAGISIENVMSATESPSCCNLFDVDLQSGHSSDASFKMHNSLGTPSQNAAFESLIAASSSGMGIMAPTLNNSEEDDDIIVCEPSEGSTASNGNKDGWKKKHRITDDQAMEFIKSIDPNADELLKNASEMMRRLYITFWVKASFLKDIPGLLKEKDIEIQRLKKKIILAKKELDARDERLKNASQVFDLVTGAMVKDHEESKKLIDQKYEKIINDLRKTGTVFENKDKTEAEVQTDNSWLEDDAVKEYKTFDWCCVCLKPAKIHCCWNGSWNTNYCGEEHQKENVSRHIKHCTKAPPKGMAAAQERIVESNIATRTTQLIHITRVESTTQNIETLVENQSEKFISQE